MITETVKLAKKNLGSPDVTRECGHGKLELATLEDTTLAGWHAPRDAFPRRGNPSWPAPPSHGCPCRRGALPLAASRRWLYHEWYEAASWKRR